MFNELYNYFDLWLGLTTKELLLTHMIARAFFCYVLGIIVLNVINKRFVGEKAPFDTILKFIVGSSLANAITGNSPFFPTVGMVFFIVILNWFLSIISFYSSVIEKILKGSSDTLYKNHNFNLKALRRHSLTKDDVLSEMRKITGIKHLNEIDEIIFENSGEISIIPFKDQKPHHNFKISHDESD